MRKKIRDEEQINLLKALSKVDKIAREEHDGHYTLFSFTGGYKVVFGTTTDPREYLHRTPQHATLSEALEFAVKANKDVMDYIKMEGE